MADYSSANISTLYQTILGLVSGNIAAALKTVQDGDGNDTALQLGTGRVKSTGTLESDGNATIGGSVTATSYSGSAANMTGVQSAAYGFRTETSNYSISDGDEVIIMNGTSLGLTLPTAADNEGKVYHIVNENASALTLLVSGQTIIGNGTSTAVDRSVAARSNVSLLCANSKFYIIAGAAT